MMSVLASVRQFLVLFFWELPLCRESDRYKRFDIVFSYLMVCLVLCILAFLSKPYFFPGTFPDIKQLEVIEGTLIRHPSRRDDKYANEPVGVHTISGDIFKECSSLGNRCLAGPNEPNDWQFFVGKPARMWFWKDWLVQLEIDGRIPHTLSYENSKRVFTSLGGASILGILVGAYLLFRLIQRYGRIAVFEAFKQVRGLKREQ